MIVVAPAVVFGAVVVFLVGFGMTVLVLFVIAETRKGGSSKQRGYLTEKNITRIATVVGVMAVALVVVLLLVVPKESARKIWLGLTIIGVVFGLLTFLFNESTTKDQTRAKYRPSTSTRRPPTQEEEYQPWTFTGARPTREKEYGPPASTQVPPPAQEDPWRILLAKVRYDQRLADRLIEYERKRLPYASLDDLCRSAIARLERNGR
jgi:hypothetical protein